MLFSEYGRYLTRLKPTGLRFAPDKGEHGNLISEDRKRMFDIK